MCLTEYRRPNSGFEITFKAAVFFFKNENTEGVLKSPIFKDTAVSRRYHHVLICFSSFYLVKKSPTDKLDHYGHKDEHTHHHITVFILPGCIMQSGFSAFWTVFSFLQKLFKFFLFQGSQIAVSAITPAKGRKSITHFCWLRKEVRK